MTKTVVMGRLGSSKTLAAIFRGNNLAGKLVLLVAAYIILYRPRFSRQRIRALRYVKIASIALLLCSWVYDVLSPADGAVILAPFLAGVFISDLALRYYDWIC